MSDKQKPKFNPDPEAPEHQTAAHWYMIMKEAHEVGLLAQRRLEALNALPDDSKLFLTKNERRGLTQRSK